MFCGAELMTYIDPMSGSLLLQALIAGALGIGWRIVTLFRRRGRALDPKAAPIEGEPRPDSPDPSDGQDQSL